MIATHQIIELIMVLRAMWSTYNIILPYLVQSLNEKHTKAAHQPEAQNLKPQYPLCRKPGALLMRAILPRPRKIRGGVLGQHEGGGSEYLIRKIREYEPSVFLQNTLENVAERYLWARKTPLRSCCAWVKRFMTYDCAPRAPTCDKKFENLI